MSVQEGNLRCVLTVEIEKSVTEIYVNNIKIGS